MNTGDSLSRLTLQLSPTSSMLLRPDIFPVLPRRRLLVSFQSAAELENLIDFKPDWVDLKSPPRGSLGCPQFSEAQAFLSTVDRLIDRSDCPISLALGEWLEQNWRTMKGVATEFDYVKVGLAGMNKRGSLVDSLIETVEFLEVKGRLIPAHYADCLRADSPNWNDVLKAAVEIESPFILIDTFDKKAGRLWDYVTTEQLLRYRLEAKQHGIDLAVAGSIQIEELARIGELGVLIAGVRGAVCEFGSRNRPVDRARLQQAAEVFAGIDRVAT